MNIGVASFLEAAPHGSQNSDDKKIGLTAVVANTILKDLEQSDILLGRAPMSQFQQKTLPSSYVTCFMMTYSLALRVWHLEMVHGPAHDGVYMVLVGAQHITDTMLLLYTSNTAPRSGRKSWSSISKY